MLSNSSNTNDFIAQCSLTASAGNFNIFIIYTTNLSKGCFVKNINFSCNVACDFMWGRTLDNFVLLQSVGFKSLNFIDSQGNSSLKTFVSQHQQGFPNITQYSRIIYPVNTILNLNFDNLFLPTNSGTTGVLSGAGSFIIVPFTANITTRVNITITEL